MKIYTKSGDKGQTSLVSGKRVSKSNPRVDCYGNVDELNSSIGIVAAHLNIPDLNQQISHIQNQLFNLGSNLACDDAELLKKLPQVEDKHIKMLESYIDEMQKKLPTIKNFILPGGHPASAFCQLSRSICRRAERSVIELSNSEDLPLVYIEYLNRLSDYLFVLARNINHLNGMSEPQWKKDD